MAVTTEKFSREFGRNWGDTMDSSMRNFADSVAVEISKRAPFLNGDLVKSIHATKRLGTGHLAYDVVAGVPYAILRNDVNHLHPQTVHYVQQGLSIAKAGDHRQWWRSFDSQ